MSIPPLRQRGSRQAIWLAAAGVLAAVVAVLVLGGSGTQRADEAAAQGRPHDPGSTTARAPEGARAAATSLEQRTSAVAARTAPALPGLSGRGHTPIEEQRLDRRFEGVHVAPSAVQRAILRRFGDVEVGWTPLAVPHALRARSGALTAPSDAGAEEIARTFLRNNAPLFRQQPQDVGGLKLTMRDRSAGASYVRFAQVHDGRPVHGSSLLVVVDARGRVLLAGGSLAPSFGTAPRPQLTAAEAVERVAADVSPRATVRPPKLLSQSADGSSATFENRLALRGLGSAAPVRAELVVVPAAHGGTTAWRVRAEIASNADYEVLVDARTGEIVYRVNAWSASEPHGRVHTGDDPEAGGQTNNVLFSGINGTWVAGDTTTGNNVDAYQDLDENDAADANGRPVNADQHFDYTFTNTWGTTGVLPRFGTNTEDRDAVVTQLFYYTNWWHDYAYDLGFDEAARNFQEDNFGLGGTGGDRVLAEADDGYGDATGTQMLCTDDGNPILCRNNANFHAGGADGADPRMQMYVGEVDLGGGMFRRTQRAMNRDTVIHEYTHGISGRIISNGNLAGDVQSGALGEGFSDAFATSVNNDAVYGEYNNGDYTNGIRGVAYDDDNLEYGDLCNNGMPNPCQVHDDGRIWAMAMWEQRTALIAKHGFTDGKALHEQLMMTGLMNTPGTPSFHDARSGYLTADSVLDADPAWPDAGNQCLIWRVFADNELGVTGGPDADNDQTPTVSTTTPAACDPQAVIAPPAVTPEGTAVSLDGTGSVVGGDAGDTLTYAWDLDDDGQYDDATGATTSVTFGDNGTYTVSLQVTNTAGYNDTVDATVTVTNVAPTVTIDAAQVTSRVENEALSVLAHFTDPGWEDTYASSVDPGTSFLAAQTGTLVVGTQGPPQDEGTVSATITYGDNGSFTVTVTVTDDDGGSGSDSFGVTVSNLDPTAAIDETGTVLVNGIPTIFADAGQTVPLTARVQDEGSDDETWSWDWGDGSASTPVKNQVNPPADEPLVPSPTVQPRDFMAPESHAWAEACMYDVTFSVDDDDGGSTSDLIKVLITQPPTLSRGAGYWQHQYRGNGNISFSIARLNCYLAIAAYLSDVFNEVRDASTIQKAHEDIFVAGLNGSMEEQLDRQLLAAWVNFANGGVEYTEMLDTDGNGTLDTSFVDVMANAETVRLDAGATRSQLIAQRDILTRINGRDGQ